MNAGLAFPQPVYRSGTENIRGGDGTNLRRVPPKENSPVFGTVREARDRIERISDPGVLAEEALSYAAAAEYGAATLLGGMLLRYTAVEKKANIAAGEGFGYLIKARTGMASR